MNHETKIITNQHGKSFAIPVIIDSPMRTWISFGEVILKQILKVGVFGVKSINGSYYYFKASTHVFRKSRYQYHKEIQYYIDGFDYNRNITVASAISIMLSKIDDDLKEFKQNFGRGSLFVIQNNGHKHDGKLFLISNVDDQGYCHGYTVELSRSQASIHYKNVYSTRRAIDKDGHFVKKDV